MQVEIIKCHGSGNDFIMVDTTRLEAAAATIDWSEFALKMCNRKEAIGSDGLLLVVRHEDGVYGMDMLNPDGTHAEMCGNGIRCVARLAAERGYLERGILRSGGRDYTISPAEPLAEAIPCYAVDIPIATHSRDFTLLGQGKQLVGEVIPSFDQKLRFTALNLGNPHIVAAVERIDMAHLEHLGQSVKQRKDLFERGVNISLYEAPSEGELFVATYERGAGITLSCGTAMTASSSAAALLGLVKAGTRIKVRNRGGVVHCTTTITSDGIVTRLEGNATYEWLGVGEIEDGVWSHRITTHTDEQSRWLALVDNLNRV